VIGASTGIGEHIAYAYAAAGVRDLIITSRNQQDLLPVVGRLKQQSPSTKAQIASVDVASEETVAQLAHLIDARYGGLDILVLNAGYSNPNAFMCDALPSEVKKAFDVNALGTYSVAYGLAPLLIRQPRKDVGMFLVIGSGSSALRRGPFCNPGYSISKLAQARMVEYLAERYDTETLLSIAIDPGTVMTRMSRNNLDPAFYSCKHDLHNKSKAL
jgi:NAD(P)-dependent dehydrogenase (short-subunit alcohol dehydrogenase family)